MTVGWKRRRDAVACSVNTDTARAEGDSTARWSWRRLCRLSCCPVGGMYIDVKLGKVDFPGCRSDKVVVGRACRQPEPVSGGCN